VGTGEEKKTDGAFKEVIHDLDDEGLKIDEEAVVVVQQWGVGRMSRGVLEESVGEGSEARVEGVDVVCDGGVERTVEVNVGGESGGTASCSERCGLQRLEMVVVHGEEQHVLGDFEVLCFSEDIPCQLYLRILGVSPETI